VHNCPLDHPDVAQVEPVPEISPAVLERARQALATKERTENNPRCPLYRRRIQFESDAAMKKAGVDHDLVEQDDIVETVGAHGETGYDPTRVARLATPVPGRVWRVDKQIGDTVAEGDLLALIDAVDVGKAKAELLQALAQVDVRSRTVERQRPLVGGAVSLIQFQESEAALREAQIRLVSAQQALVNLGLPINPDELKGLSPENANRRVQFLGLPEAVVQGLDPKMTTANLLPIRAPFAGVVVTRDAAVGEFTSPSNPLFVVVDHSRIWLTLHVRLEDAKHVALGQRVQFQPDAGGPKAQGIVDWISTAVDKEKTRTLKVRAILANPQGLLRAGMFGAGDIILREAPAALTVPNEAVHWDGSCHVVFVRDKDFFKPGPNKIFHTRTIRPGVKDEKKTEIIVGLLPGESVATKGSGVLRAELLKNTLGEG
jgi:cobalt-zinc-cadmium efflux system membrane fusion protein